LLSFRDLKSDAGLRTYKGEPTVGTPQQQLGFLFSKTQVAFMYDYKYRVEWTLLERFWFVLPTSIKYVSKQRNV